MTAYYLVGLLSHLTLTKPNEVGMMARATCAHWRCKNELSLPKIN